jgi:hypothetical protein
MSKLGFCISLLGLALVASSAHAAADEPSQASSSPQPPLEPPPPALAPTSSQPVAVTKQPASPASTTSGDALAMAGLVTEVVGVGALVAGLVLNLKANSMVDDVQNRYDAGKYSSSKDYKIASEATYAAGGICVAGGLLLMYFAVFSGGMAVTPVALEGGAGAMLTGTFQ